MCNKQFCGWCEMVNRWVEDVIDFHEFLWKRIFRSNGKLLQPIKKEEKWNKKARRRLSNIFFLLSGGGVCVGSMAWGGRELEGKKCWLGKARGWDG
jgi:hypothetical protein